MIIEGVSGMEEKKEKKKPGFESKIKRLEEIVGKMESSEVELEESIKLFEEGMSLSKDCQGILDNAEQKVKVLTTTAEGETVLKDFNESE